MDISHLYREEVLNFTCNYCRKKCLGVRFFCLYCDMNQLSCDICKNCEPEHQKTHKLFSTEKTIITLKKFIAISDSLESLLNNYCERRLFGRLKKRNNQVDPKRIGIEYLSEEELKELGMQKEEFFLKEKKVERIKIEEDEEFTNFSKDHYYDWMTYGECYHLSRSMATGLRTRYDKGTFVGIFSENCVPWFIIDFGCIFSAMVSVPIHSNFNAEQLVHITNQTKMKILFVSLENLSKALKVANKCESLEVIVCMQENWEASENEKENLLKENQISEKIKLLSFEEMLVKEKEKWTEREVSLSKEIASLIYTSGSTGMPKGSIITGKMLNVEFFDSNPINTKFKDLISFIFAPLSWSSERFSAYGTIAIGGRMAFWSGSMESFFFEAKLTSPTYFSAPPRIWIVLYNQFKSLLSKQLKQDSNSDPNYIEKKLLAKFSKVFGERVFV